MSKDTIQLTISKRDHAKLVKISRRLGKTPEECAQMALNWWMTEINHRKSDWYP